MQLIALDPGHFHASLVQQQMYPDIDSVIQVYAPEGPEVEQYLQRLAAYNKQGSPEVHWIPNVYTGSDYLQQLLLCAPGNIVILAGNNRLKPMYIRSGIGAGMHVLADKPMAIDAAGFASLQASFADAAAGKVQLFDIMTERYEIHNVLQRELARMPSLFGTLQPGTASEPAVIKKSVHHFKKMVAGEALVRPGWYMDVQQQGEGITDVTTHLVDLVQWTCFPGQVLDYKKDIHIDAATTWPTAMSRAQYRDITGGAPLTAALAATAGDDGLLEIYANGSFDYTIRGVHARITVQWDYEAAAGAGDTHYSRIQGSKAALLIRQDKEQGYLPVLYISPVSPDAAYMEQLSNGVAALAQRYPGIALKAAGRDWEVVIPREYLNTHESLFAAVMQQFLVYVRAGQMPAWEVPGMIAKYYTTTQALSVAKKLEYDSRKI